MNDYHLVELCGGIATSQEGPLTSSLGRLHTRQVSNVNVNFVNVNVNMGCLQTRLMSLRLACQCLQRRQVLNVKVKVNVNVNVGQRPAASAHKISGDVNVFEISMSMSAEKTSVKSQCQRKSLAMR